MKKVIIKVGNPKKFGLYCPFTNEKLDNENNSFEIYEGAGNYLFAICEDCLFFDAGNNDEIDDLWNGSCSEAVDKFVNNYPEKNILLIEVQTEDEIYIYGFLNENNIELSDEEIEKRFIKR